MCFHSLFQNLSSYDVAERRLLALHLSKGKEYVYIHIIHGHISISLSIHYDTINMYRSVQYWAFSYARARIIGRAMQSNNARISSFSQGLQAKIIMRLKYILSLIFFSLTRFVLHLRVCRTFLTWRVHGRFYGLDLKRDMVVLENSC